MEGRVKMPVKIELETIEDAGNGSWSEDRLLSSETIVGVIDGATPIHKRLFGGCATQAEWMVDGFQKEFERLTTQGETDYRKLARQAIETLSQRDGFEALDLYDRPSFTSATVTFGDDSILCQVLGDSCIYVQFQNGTIERITDDRVDAFSSKTTAAVELARAKGENPEAAAERQKLENIRLRNTSEGYWVVAFDGAFEKEFVQREIPISEVKQILLCTDGFERIFREFVLLTPERFFEERIPLQAALKRLREHENTYFGTPDFPCVKKSDDAAAVLICCIEKE